MRDQGRVGRRDREDVIAATPKRAAARSPARTAARAVGPAPARPQARLDRAGEAVGQTIATVERAADVLVHFARSPSPTLGVTEVSEALGLSKAAVHRILTSLRTRGLIELDPDTRRYTLGLTAMHLGLAYLDRIDIRRIAAPELVALSRRTGETATLSVRTGGRRVYIDEATPDREVIMTVSLGVPYPLHAGGSSKAFLAFLPDEEIEEYLSGEPLSRLTEATVTDVDVLRKELRLIRERGWAQSFGERQSGAASVAAPVLDQHGCPAAVVSVCGPAERFRDEVDTCAGMLLEATERLSLRLGWGGHSRARTGPPR